MNETASKLKRSLYFETFVEKNVTHEIEKVFAIHKKIFCLKTQTIISRYKKTRKKLSRTLKSFEFRFVY